ncbi:MAG: VOC family protein [Alphaproteobacteria bacterium]|nr:VOC family protein [Alphaproteobacteria bacterium]
MDQRLTMITLGVRDLARARKFYEALGWNARPEGDGNIVFFQLLGLVLGLYPRAALAEDAQLPDDGTSARFGGIAIAYNARGKAEVDSVLKEAVAAGATLLKPAQEVFWGGYSGYFADPDGHPWEVAFNPHWPLESDGSLRLPTG